jgi:hypothetical protein
MENGQVLFMSRMTRSRLQDDIFADDCATAKLGSLECPMNFELFVSTEICISAVVDCSLQTVLIIP